MSLIDLLNNDQEWNKFLEQKVVQSNLPVKVIKEYEDFIINKKYEQIAMKIVAGTYTFSIPKKVLIGKMGKSKKRVVYIYEQEENYILKFLCHLLYRYDYLFSPNLYSFRQKSGVKKAIYDITKQKGLSKKYSYKLDVSNYFNSIPVENMLKALEKDLNDKRLYDLIKTLLLNDKVIYNNEVMTECKGIMAGVPISSFLANYYLKDLDQYFYEKGITYARYADDIILFANDLKEIEEYKKIINKVLFEKGLNINKNKEFIYEPGEKFEFLGFSYNNGIIDLNDNSFKKIKGKIRRTARGLRRWMLRKNATTEVTLKAMNRKFNRKFYGKNENDLTWKYWFFPTITTTKTLKEIDLYMQDWQRYVVSGVHNKRNFEKVPYSFLKQCNYKPLVSEYYNMQN